VHELGGNCICASKTYEYGCSLIHIYGEPLNMGAILDMTNSYGKCSNVLLLFMWNVYHGRGMPIWCYVVKCMSHAFISRKKECANTVMDRKLEHICNSQKKSWNIYDLPFGSSEAYSFTLCWKVNFDGNLILWVMWTKG